MATLHCRWDGLRAIQPLHSRKSSSFVAELEESGLLRHVSNIPAQIGVQTLNCAASKVEPPKPYPHTIRTQQDAPQTGPCASLTKHLSLAAPRRGGSAQEGYIYIIIIIIIITRVYKTTECHDTNQC